ncbi:MAG TPA: hypothetical protein VNS81_00800 [Nocardioides sp.]|nr:hypothetical protein [Nocardioides sp.]
MTTQLGKQQSKHRATERAAVAVRTDSAGAHRAGRTSDLPIAAALAVLVVLVAAYLAARS